MAALHQRSLTVPFPIMILEPTDLPIHLQSNADGRKSTTFDLGTTTVTLQTMNIKEAKAYAWAQFQQGVRQIQEAESVYRQIQEQVPHDVDCAIRRWKLLGHLNAAWEYHSQVGQDKFVHEMFFSASAGSLHMESNSNM